MFRNRFTVAFGMLALLTGLLAAQEKVGYVYSDQIMREYEGMSEPNTALAREKTAFRTKADSLNQLLAKARADFDAQKLLLSEEGKAAKNAEVEELQRRYDSYISEVYGPNGKLEQKNEELMAPVIQKIRDAVDKIARNDGFALVFDASESKLAILFAVSGMNLTSDVIEELNREFKPVTPSGIAEKRYAVCPLFEVDEEARQVNLGDQCRALVYEIVKAQPQVQMITNSELNTTLQNRGISGDANITEDVVYSAGKDLQADYVLFGQVTMSGKKITVTLKIADPKLDRTFAPETDTANRQEELKQVLGNITTKLLRKLPQ